MTIQTLSRLHHTRSSILRWVPRLTALVTADLALRLCTRAAGGTTHVGPFGLLALREDVDAARLERLLAAAREFAEEWSELRGLHQQKLAGRLLRRAAFGWPSKTPNTCW